MPVSHTVETDLSFILITHNIEPHPAAFGREFHGVREQVDQNLLETALVRGEDPHRFVEVKRDGDLLLEGGFLHHTQRGLTQLIDRHRARLELDLAGLDLGDIEDVIDQGQEVPAALLEVLSARSCFAFKGP